MVREKNSEFVCGECGFRYDTRVEAEACEAWCSEHKSCNLEITEKGRPPKEQ
ncbi:MAG: hypothetical protein Q8Q38_01235 [bacterium]|nr:hypothetical protein [bacterium]MDZ4231733.1 hypothetical protein [Candidatus Pacearchaeota archaeon]